MYLGGVSWYKKRKELLGKDDMIILRGNYACTVHDWRITVFYQIERNMMTHNKTGEL